MNVTSIKPNNSATPSTLLVSELSPTGIGLVTTGQGTEATQVHIPRDIIEANKLQVGVKFWGLVLPAQGESCHNLPFSLTKYLGDLSYNLNASAVSVQKLYNPQYDADLDADQHVLNAPEIWLALDDNEVREAVLDALESCQISVLTSEDVLDILLGEEGYTAPMIARVEHALEQLAENGNLKRVSAYQIES